MKYCLTILSCLFFLYVTAQTKKDSVPVNPKENFYRSYSDYLEKSRKQKPKVTTDSSVSYNRTKVSDSSNHKGTQHTEIKGTLTGRQQQSFTVLPGKPISEDSVKTVSSVSKNANKAVISTASNPKQIPVSHDVSKQKLSEYEILQQKQQGKITPDSSVYFAKSKPINNSPKVKTDKHAQSITGTIAPDKQHKSTSIEPKANRVEPQGNGMQINAAVAATASNPPVKKFVLKPEPHAKNPSETLDTNLIGAKKTTDKVSNTHSQEIKGTVLPDKKSPTIIAATVGNANTINTNPQADPVKKNALSNANTFGLKSKDPVTAYSVPSAEEAYKVSTSSSTSSAAAAYYAEGDSRFTVPLASGQEPTADDPLKKYTAENIKSGYKSQMLYNEMVAQRKNPKVLEPISADSIARKEREDSLMALMADSIKRMNEEAMRSIEEQRNTEMANALRDQSQNTRYNFYLTKTGQFSVSFSTDKFYLNINQKGKIVDFAILSNGSVTAGNLQNKVTQVGNSKILYNYRGNIDSIAGIQVTYTYDGKVNKVGNSFITYNYEGIIEKVGEIPIIYNGNSTVFRFGNFGVTYNNQGMVVGIDDSGGLIVYRPLSNDK